jgi:hypothetical protein
MAMQHGIVAFFTIDKCLFKLCFKLNIICVHKFYRLQNPCHILFSIIFSQSLCHVQNQIQELRKDTMKVRRSQALNLGQSNTNAAELSQVSIIQ